MIMIEHVMDLVRGGGQGGGLNYGRRSRKGLSPRLKLIPKSSRPIWERGPFMLGVAA